MGSELLHTNLKAIASASTVPIFLEESGNGKTPEEFKIHGQSLRPSQLSSLTALEDNHFNYNFSIIDGASLLLSDTEANPNYRH